MFFFGVLTLIPELWKEYNNCPLSSSLISPVFSNTCLTAIPITYWIYSETARNKWTQSTDHHSGEVYSQIDPGVSMNGRKRYTNRSCVAWGDWREWTHTGALDVVLVVGAFVSVRESVGVGVVEQGVVSVPPGESLEEQCGRVSSSLASNRKAVH